MFMAEDDHGPWPEDVIAWRGAVAAADAVIICTPAYLLNVPAVLKNALEWLTTSGELYNKPVLALTYTPAEPRGEEALQSLIWSLQALRARVIGQCQLFQNTLIAGMEGQLDGPDLEMLDLMFDQFL